MWLFLGVNDQMAAYKDGLMIEEILINSTRIDVLSGHGGFQWGRNMSYFD